MNTRTDNLKKATFGVMAILFFVNLSLMEKANWEQNNEVSLLGAGIDQNRQPGSAPVPEAPEVELLRATVNRLKAKRKGLVEEIDRNESRIREIELQNHKPASN